MSDAPSDGTLRAGRYAVIGVLGAGSQAETLDAVDKQAGRPVAIKRFQVRGAKSWKDVELAEREARVLSTLSHPNLPVYIEHFEEAGALYLVMEKIEGETLASLRRRKAAFSNEDIAQFLRDADSVLGYLHSRAPAIIHRDIKPGNVIRRADGSFAIVDFGSVRDQLKPEGGSTVVGTFGYMAPEQFQGRSLPGSDVYAVGATALALATGREPEALPHRGLAIDVAAALGRGAEPWLLRALGAMLEPDPDKRPARVSTQRPNPRTKSSARESWSAQAHDDAREYRRRLREESRRLRRERRPRHRHGLGPPGLLITAVVILALTVARIATWWLFRFVLPFWLWFWSILFGRGLRLAAARCREIGIAGDRGLVQAMQAVQARLLGGPLHDADSEPDAPGRTSDPTEIKPHFGAPERVRVAEPEAQGTLADDADQELAAKFDELRRREERSR